MPKVPFSEAFTLALGIRKFRARCWREKMIAYHWQSIRRAKQDRIIKIQQEGTLYFKSTLSVIYHVLQNCFGQSQGYHKVKDLFPL